MFRAHLLLSLLVVALGADGSESTSGLRGAHAAPGAAAESDPSAAGPEHSIGCSCAAGGACRCSHSQSSGPRSEEVEQLEQAVLNRTKQLNTWWQAQNETVRLTPWNGPMLNQSTALWWGGGGGWGGGGWGHGGWGGGGFGGGCRRGGGCGCLVLGCGCVGHSGCGGGVWR